MSWVVVVERDGKEPQALGPYRGEGRAFAALDTVRAALPDEVAVSIVRCLSVDAWLSTADADEGHRRTVLVVRQARARALGLCGERFGHYGVCDEPAGHGPISEAMGWLHAETINGPLGNVLDELYADRLSPGSSPGVDG